MFYLSTCQIACKVFKYTKTKQRTLSRNVDRKYDLNNDFCNFINTVTVYISIEQVYNFSKTYAEVITTCKKLARLF